MQQHAGTKVPLPKRRLHEGHADPFSLPEALAVRPTDFASSPIRILRLVVASICYSFHTLEKRLFSATIVEGDSILLWRNAHSAQTGALR
jgi:hypothetical protein